MRRDRSRRKTAYWQHGACSSALPAPAQGPRRLRPAPRLTPHRTGTQSRNARRRDATLPGGPHQEVSSSNTQILTISAGAFSLRMRIRRLSAVTNRNHRLNGTGSVACRRFGRLHRKWSHSEQFNVALLQQSSCHRSFIGHEFAALDLLKRILAPAGTSKSGAAKLRLRPDVVASALRWRCLPRRRSLRRIPELHAQEPRIILSCPARSRRNRTDGSCPKQNLDHAAGSAAQYPANDRRMAVASDSKCPPS